MMKKIFGQTKNKELERELAATKAELATANALLEAAKEKLAKFEAKQEAETSTEGMAATERWKRQNAEDKAEEERKKIEWMHEFYSRAEARINEFMGENQLVLAEIIIFPKSGTIMYRRQGWSERSIIFGGSRRSQDRNDYFYDIEMLAKFLAPLGWRVRKKTQEEEFFLSLEEVAP